MIKIELSDKQKEKIEGLLLADLVEGTQKGKRGKLIEDLDTDACRALLKNDNPKLYDHLYDGEGKPNTEKVKELLLANREEMERLIGEFGHYTLSEKEKSEKLLNVAFRYTNFSTRNVARDILREMNLSVCPYCNRLYITVLKDRRVRPQLDHFFPKSRYPYLALSLYNLVPSCGVCNQAKSERDTLGDSMLYPYEEEFGEEIVFALDLKDQDNFVQKMRGESTQIKVCIKKRTKSSLSNELPKQVKQQDEWLHLTELYGEHGDYVADILKNYHINTKARVIELLKRFPYLFATEDEVRSLMFMNKISKDQWGKRPLAKLTHDICSELDELFF